MGKQGGGTQGRESKTKSVKKKYKAGRGAAGDDGSDDDTVTSSKARTTEIEFLSVEEIEEELKKNEILSECPDDLISEIAQHLFR